MELAQAEIIAHELLRMAPYCEIVRVAGSIRRRKPHVKDIEICAVPRWSTSALTTNLFSDKGVKMNQLHAWALRSGIRWIKPGTSEIIDWPPKAEAKYLRALLPEGIKLDLFIATPETWGCSYLIRTGSAEFSQAIVTHALKVGAHVQDGRLRGAAGPIDTPTEHSVFEALGLEYVEPQNRIDGAVLRVKP